MELLSPHALAKLGILSETAAVDPVGREDRTKDLSSENYNENLLSEYCAKIFSSEDHDKIITTEVGQW